MMFRRILSYLATFRRVHQGRQKVGISRVRWVRPFYMLTRHSSATDQTPTVGKINNLSYNGDANYEGAIGMV
ncbi:hypothetical protein BDW75DRAFT_177534 [Aspergillus navahoensis]